MSSKKLFKNVRALAAGLVMAGMIGPAMATEDSIAQTIRTVRYSSQWTIVYVTADAGWGAPSCPNARIAQFTGTTPNGKIMLAMVLAAKAQGAKISFAGDCDTDTAYFNVNYVVIE